MLAPRSAGEAGPERNGEPGHENRQHGDGRADEAHDEEDGDERQDQDGRPCALSKTATTKRRMTPASMAAATEDGMRSISAPTGRMKAVTRIRAPASRNAPTADSMESPLVASMSAAPGVDQAVMIGRWRRLRKPLVAAMLRQSAATQEEVWAG